MTYRLTDKSKGILLAVLATILFATQDAAAKMLVKDHSVWFIVMARFWFAFIAALVWASVSKNGLHNSVRTGHPWLQILRSILLFTEIALIIAAFSMLGLAEVTTIIMAHPLIVTVLAVFVLGERVGWRTILALFVGMFGLIIIMQPSGDIWGPGALIGLGATTSFALYQLITRMVSDTDTAQTSFFYAAAIGLILSTLPGIMAVPAWETLNLPLLAMVLVFSTAGHFAIMKALSMTLASDIQPFAYFQIVWSIPIGFLVFGDFPLWTTLLGAVLIVSAGLFSIHRSTRRKQAQ